MKIENIIMFYLFSIGSLYLVCLIGASILPNKVNKKVMGTINKIFSWLVFWPYHLIKWLGKKIWTALFPKKKKAKSKSST